MAEDKTTFDPKITKGKWICGSDSEHDSIMVIRDGDYDRPLIDSHSDTDAIDDGPEVVGNARAIAAIPELLSVYKEAKKFLGRLHETAYETNTCMDDNDLIKAINNLEKNHNKEEES